MRDLLLPAIAGLLVFAPWLIVELLGGRAAMSALTGMDLELLPLALLELTTWSWMVFATGPWLAGSMVWLLLGGRRAYPGS